MNKPLTPCEFSRRRRELIRQLAPHSLAILSAATHKIRSRDTEYHFRQDSDFYYLTGFEEPEAVMVLVPGREPADYIMFCRPNDKEKELWEGKRAGLSGVKTDFGVEESYSIEEINKVLPMLCEGREKIYYQLGQNTHFDSQVLQWINTIKSKVRKGISPPRELVDLSHTLHDMRLIKNDAELVLLSESAKIGASAHCRAMKQCRPGLFEYQLEAHIRHEFALSGARFAAYNSIVGGGENACVLHYTDNNDPLQDGDLVLIDAGCEYHYYATDITRTFPINGQFNDVQKKLYNLVLKAQEAAIAQVRPGALWNTPHDIAVQIITEGLVELGLLKGNVESLIQNEAYKPFYMHKIGHWLGMDVHDVGAYKRNGDWRVLEPGMVMTIEPGIYIAQDNADVAPQWRGIGIRIEDVVVVTSQGSRVLTSDVPKSPEAIEALMSDQ